MNLLIINFRLYWRSNVVRKRIIGHVITSQGGHTTNKLLLKFFSDKSNWSLKTAKQTIKKLKLMK